MALQRYFQIIVVLLAFCRPLTSIGQVFYVSENKNADLMVYVTEFKADADLVVFKTSYRSEAVGDVGLWYFTENKSDADKVIAFAKHRAHAGITIYYTQFRNDAGWQKKTHDKK